MARDLDPLRPLTNAEAQRFICWLSTKIDDLPPDRNGVLKAVMRHAAADGGIVASVIPEPTKETSMCAGCSRPITRLDGGPWLHDGGDRMRGCRANTFVPDADYKAGETSYDESIPRASNARPGKNLVIR